jgi:hypothetical protein
MQLSHWYWLGACAFATLVGCSDDETPSESEDNGSQAGGTVPNAGAGPDASAGAGPDASAGAGPDASAGTGPGSSADELEAPEGSDKLLPFLEAGEYQSWPAEREVHDSAGPHGSGVRVFYSPKAAAAIEQGDAKFPAGAAIIKELYDAGDPSGWAVTIKVQPDSAGGQGFYWYELVGERVYADERGTPVCVNCHQAGQDFLLSSGAFAR